MMQCGLCAFWDHSVVGQGLCRRRAPLARLRQDEVTHWPMTKPTDGCGDGVPVGAATRLACVGCLFWRPNPGGGLNPLNRGDERKAWWQAAGHCLRHAPSPGADPGHRGFWSATHRDDGCGEGAAGDGAPPARPSDV